MAAILMVDDHLTADGVGGRNRGHPALVIAAILLPHGDGYEFVSQRREGVSANDAGRKP